MPNVLPEQLVLDAEAAVEYAQTVRRLHRRRTDRSNPQRQTDIELAKRRVKEAMRPLRTEIGKFPYGPQNDVAEANRDVIREASRALQTERRKLWKMNK